VYNNFPWPQTLTKEQILKVEKHALNVLETRKLFPTSTLADLYDPNTMPPELVRAHQALDREVEKCYRDEPFKSDRERVEFLFKLYEEITTPLAVTTKPKRKSRA
jgi:hypothetical protein